jgi:hypothetical protein
LLASVDFLLSRNKLDDKLFGVGLIGNIEISVLKVAPSLIPPVKHSISADVNGWMVRFPLVMEAPVLGAVPRAGYEMDSKD